MTRAACVWSVALVLMLGTTMAARQAAPVQGGGAAGRGGARGGGAAAPAAGAPAVQQVSSRPPVDMAAHDRGRVVWARECITCHGTQARGSDTGPNIIRTKTVNFDRSAAIAGSVLGPFLKAGHQMQSGKSSATLTDDEIVGLANFIRARVNDTMRSATVFTVGDIVVGNAAAGEAFFKGEGKCASCHTATAHNLSDIARRIPVPVDLQQRMLFPFPGRGRATGPVVANPNVITATITPAGGPAITGVLIEQSDFYVTVRLADGTLKVVKRAPTTTIVITNPMQAHVDLLDVLTDTQIHDLLAYLETMK